MVRVAKRVWQLVQLEVTVGARGVEDSRVGLDADLLGERLLGGSPIACG